MNTVVEIDQEQAEALDKLAAREGHSRASLIYVALGEYLAKRQSAPEADDTSSAERGRDNLKAAFGLWKDRKIDGLAYQEQLRSEW